jgi:hypothetical protein
LKRRADARAFVVRWAETGRVLAEERAARLGALDDDTARAMTRDLFRSWRSPYEASTTSGLVEQQRLFQALRRRRTHRR